jgi:hypothetical protein
MTVLTLIHYFISLALTLGECFLKKAGFSRAESRYLINFMCWYKRAQKALQKS